MWYGLNIKEQEIFLQRWWAIVALCGYFYTVYIFGKNVLNLVHFIAYRLNFSNEVFITSYSSSCNNPVRPAGRVLLWTVQMRTLKLRETQTDKVSCMPIGLWPRFHILNYTSASSNGGIKVSSVQFISVTRSCWRTLRSQGMKHTRLPCPPPTPRACSNSCPTSWWCHRTIAFSVIPFSSCLQSFPASRYFPMSQFFTSGGQSIEVSALASVLPVNIQDWFPLGWTAVHRISLQYQGLSRVFSNTTVQKHQFFNAQLSL